MEIETLMFLIMKRRFLLPVLICGPALFASAGNMQRIGHATLTPRHSNPDDKGMYAAFIDATNGYAYFVGTGCSSWTLPPISPCRLGRRSTAARLFRAPSDERAFPFVLTPLCAARLLAMRAVPLIEALPLAV